jgi:hypothetical protein
MIRPLVNSNHAVVAIRTVTTTGPLSLDVCKDIGVTVAPEARGRSL